MDQIPVTTRAVARRAITNVDPMPSRVTDVAHVPDVPADLAAQVVASEVDVGGMGKMETQVEEAEQERDGR
ncbi:MAG: hypothetical protein ACYC6V_07100 [Bacillota bacterium]